MNAHNEQHFTAADMADQAAAAFERGRESVLAERAAAAPGIDRCSLLGIVAWWNAYTGPADDALFEVIRRIRTLIDASPLYAAASVAAAQEAVAWINPDDLSESERAVVCLNSVRNLSCNERYTMPLYAAPVAAAPGIDLRNAILHLRDDALDWEDPGDTVNAYDRVLRLIDANPKGERVSNSDELAVAAAPEGFVMVPVEPTPEMLQAAAFAVSGKSGQKFKPMMAAGYTAMLAARPQEAKDAG